MRHSSRGMRCAAAATQPRPAGGRGAPRGGASAGRGPRRGGGGRGAAGAPGAPPRQQRPGPDDWQQPRGRPSSPPRDAGGRPRPPPPPPAQTGRAAPPAPAARGGGGDAAASLATRTAQVAKQGACYGCGAPLQIEIPSGPGYVKPDKYETKRRHKQLNQVCFCGPRSLWYL